MAELKNEKLGVSFTLPDNPTVRQQMQYLSQAAFAFESQRFEQYWLGALTLIGDWKCDLLPDPHKLNLDAETNPKIADLASWAGWEVKLYMDRLEEVPKNS